jgi:hypothetical protein
VEVGQTEKNSARACVFRSTIKLGRRSISRHVSNVPNCDIKPCRPDVWYRRTRDVVRCLKRAHNETFVVSFDYFVGGSQDRRGNLYAQTLCGL